MSRDDLIAAKREDMRRSAYARFGWTTERARKELLKDLEFASNATIVVEEKKPWRFLRAVWGWHKATPIELGRV